MLWGIYASGIMLAFALAYILRHSVLKGDEAPFVMELPPYRLPTVRAVALKMSERAWLYLRKAGTVILGISILMWAISAYPQPDRFAVDVALDAGEITILDVADPQGLTESDLEARRRSALARAFGRPYAAMTTVTSPGATGPVSGMDVSPAGRRPSAR